jgi:CDP-L-myo-inositol myo-inositolphosphotransferase
VGLLGLTLIERVILTAKQAGITEFVVVIGRLKHRIRERLGRGERYGVKIEYVENLEWERGNGVSVLKAKEVLREDFLLLMSDHIFDARILKGIIGCKPKGAVVLAVDRKEPLSEDTKVIERDGKVVDIGKDLHGYSCVDTGIFHCSPKVFFYIEEAVKVGKEELSDGIAEAAKRKDAEIFDISKIGTYDSGLRKELRPWWIDIDTKEDLKEAEALILEAISKNPSDLLACYVHKPIENKLVAFISNFNITANQLTIVVNILAYIVTTLFFLGYLLPGSILAFVVGIVDGLDGKLARVKLSTSRLGSLEHSFDLLFEFSWFIGLSWALFVSTQSVIPLILCIFIILFIAFYRHIYDQFRRAMGRSLDDSGGFERIFRRVAGRRNLYNIPILLSVLLKVPLYSLVFIVFHSGVTAVVYSVRAFKHLHAADKGLWTMRDT